MTEIPSPSTPIVTIAFIPRERFSRAADALRQLIENTKDVPFKLIVVDCKTPERYRRDIEAVVRGDRRTSRVIGRSLEELDLPEATTIGGIVRGDKLLIAHHDVVIEPGDHVILFVMDKRQMPQVNALFQAGAG